MITFANHASGPYLSQAELPPDVAEMERAYSLGMPAGSVTERVIAGFAPLVASGTLWRSEALDAMAQAYLAAGGNMDWLDAAIERWGDMLNAAIDRGPIVAAVPRLDMHPLAAHGLGIDRTQPVSQEALEHLLRGYRADGTRIEGKHYHPTSPNGAYDFAVTAPKPTSVGWAFAPPIERAMIHTAHTEAARDGMAVVGQHMGQARSGRGGRGDREPGHIAWVEFSHHTARPTSGAPGDPNVHTHFAVPNAVFCESGRVGSLNTKAAVVAKRAGETRYHQQLGENLREAGFDARADGSLASVPKPVSYHFSKRAQEGTERGRERAESRGAVWTDLRPEAQSKWVKAGTQHPSQKLGKEGLADFRSWFAQGMALGWEPKSLMAVGVALAVTRPVHRAADNLLASLTQLRRETVQTFQHMLHRTQDKGPTDTALSMKREDRGVRHDMGQNVVEKARQVSRDPGWQPVHERPSPRLTIPL